MQNGMQQIAASRRVYLVFLQLCVASGGPVFSALPERIGEKRGAWRCGWRMLHLSSGKNQT